jgi:hypothetical protein
VQSVRNARVRSRAKGECLNNRTDRRAFLSDAAASHHCQRNYETAGCLRSLGVAQFIATVKPSSCSSAWCSSERLGIRGGPRCRIRPACTFRLPLADPAPFGAVLSGGFTNRLRCSSPCRLGRRGNAQRRARLKTDEGFRPPCWQSETAKVRRLDRKAPDLLSPLL